MDDISKYLTTQNNYSLISISMPLLSNLNMVENIALIKEVIFRVPTKEAQRVANEFLKKIELLHISLQRIENCSNIEIFYVMLIRALMSKEKTIIIESPYLIIKEIVNITDLMKNINLLNKNKKIVILDIENNAIHYEGCSCNIIK